MILLGMGSNLPSAAGAPRATLEAALAALDQSGLRIVKRSRWYRSVPVPASDQPDFVNGVVAVETALEPAELLALLHRIEARFGRARREVNAARSLDLDLLAYDDQFFPASRHVFIKSWILQPEGAALGLLIDDELAGYGVLRKCYQGYKIGPLFADSPEIANSLFCALCGHASEGSQVFLDVPEPNSTALELAKRHKMLPVFETVRMYNKDAPLLPMNRIFGVTSFELG